MSEKLSKISRPTPQLDLSLNASEIWRKRNPDVALPKITHQFSISVKCRECYLPTQVDCPGYVTLNQIEQHLKDKKPARNGAKCGCHGWETVEISNWDIPNPFKEPIPGRERAQSKISRLPLAEAG